MSWLYTIILYAKGTYYSRKLCAKKKRRHQRYGQLAVEYPATAVFFCVCINAKQNDTAG